MKAKIVDFFKSFTTFEWIFLSISLVAVTVVSIVFQCDALSIIYSIVGLSAVFLLSKGVFFAPIPLILMYSIYTVQAWLNGLYGEVILNLAILIPIQIYTIFRWLKKRKNSGIKSEKAIIGDIGWKEWLCIAVGYIVIGVCAYFLLDALNTNYLYLSTISFANACVANYLTMRGNAYQFVVYIINNFVLIAMWLMPIFEGAEYGTNFVPMAVSFVAFMVSNVYGLVNWIKLKKSRQFAKDYIIIKEDD